MKSGQSHSAPPKLTIADAMSAPTEHAFLPGHGYIRLGAPQILQESMKRAPLKDVAPPASAKSGTQHFLQPPKNAKPMSFEWKAGAWFRAKGNRIAWSPAYLAANGWTYLRPV